jgi:hypothetical protein
MAGFLFKMVTLAGAKKAPITEGTIPYRSIINQLYASGSGQSGTVRPHAYNMIKQLSVSGYLL